MTVSTLGFTHSYYPGAAQAPERIPFQFLDIADLHVTADLTGLLLVAGTDYVISGSGQAATATITTLRTFASNDMVTIRRVSARVQQAVTEPFKPLPAADIGRELDRRAMVEQELDGEISRALKVPRGQVGPLVDLRGAEGKILQLFGGKIRGVPYYVPPGGSGTGAEYNVLDYGAKGHGTDHDDTPGFQAAMDAAWYAGGGTVVIPATPAGYNLAGPNIPFPSSPDSYVKRAVLKLRPNVSIRGVGMPLVRISGGRHNPPGMLFQAWWENDRIDNVDISGVWWDAACYSERLGPRNGNTYDGGSDVEESGIYQFQHAIAIWAGSNIRIHGNKFSSFRGSGVFPGNVGNLTPDAYLCDNVHVHNNEFVDMFRDAVFPAAVSSGSAYHNWCHGDGYWVAVFDIERTTANETLTGFKVYQNFIDGSDGLRPIELGRPGTTLVRACSLGFFYDGYPNDIADGKFRGHSFNDNLVYHGVIDCWNPTDCSISDNVIINDVADIIPNGNLIASAAISLRYSSGGIGVRKVDVKRNKILHNIRCTAPFKTSYGIWCVGYRDINVSDNYVEGAELDGIRADYCTGVVERNRIVNCGTVDDRATGVVASASPDQIVIRDNIIEDQRGGDDRTIAHAVSLDGYFARWPVVTGNIGANVHGALINGEALGFCHGNKDYTNSWTTNADVRIGGTLRAAGETTIGDSASDAAVVISAGGGDRAQLILSQSGAIEWILGQLGDGTLIEQNFAMGMFERNVRIVYPDGTYQLALSWDQPLKANSNDYLWFEDGQLVVKSGSKATGPGQGTPLIGAGGTGGSSLDSVLASRALSSGDFPDRDDTIALLPVGAYFTSDETGEPRTYRATATSPYYEDQGDDAAPLSRGYLGSSQGGSLVGVSRAALAGGLMSVQDFVSSIDASLVMRFAIDPAYAETEDDASDYFEERFADAAVQATGFGSRALIDIPLGRYFIDRMISIPPGVDIEGSGAGTIIDASRTLMQTAIAAIGTDGTRVANLKVVGSGQGSQPINGSGLTNAEILSRIAVSGSGIVFAGVSRGRVENVIVESCGGLTGVLPYNGVAGVWLTYGCNSTTVKGCHVSDARNGINEDNFFGADPRNNRIIYNNVTTCRFGIALDSGPTAANTLVHGNSVTACLQSGIDLNKPQRARITNNYVSFCGSESGNSGIFCYGTGAIPVLDVIISNNQCYGNYGHGIKVGPYTYYVQVIGNNCRTNSKHGIFVQGISRYWTVSDNICRDNTLSGYYMLAVPESIIGTGTASIADTTLTVTDATLSNAIDVGHHVQGGGIAANTIITARLSGTGGIGTYTVNAAQTVASTAITIKKDVGMVISTGTVNANHATQNKQHGFLFDGAAEIAISANIAKGNSQEAPNTYDGIRLTNATINCNLTGNHSSGSSQRYAVAGTDSLTTGNSFVGNIFLPGASGRFGFANWTQTWQGNDDEYLTVAGAPGGRWPNGFRAWNNGDQAWYTQLSTGAWNIVTTISGVTTRGDVDLVLTYNSNRPTQRFNSPLTVNRTITLNIPTIPSGARFRILRSSLATGAFDLSIVAAGVTLKALSAGQWTDVEYDEGSAVWIVTAAGAL